MGVFLSSVLFSVFVYLSVTQIVRNLNPPEPHEDNAKWLPLVLIALLLGLLLDLCSAGRPEMISLMISIALTAVFPSSCSMVPDAWSRVLAMSSSGLQVVLSAVALIGDGLYEFRMSACVLSVISSLMCCIPAVLLVAGVYRRIRDIKVVMRTGSVWTMLCLSVDTVYGIVILIYAVLIPVMKAWISVILLSSVLVALCIRIRNNSVFVLMTSHERRIIESMRLSQAEYIGENQGADILYDNIYERLLRYFETQKPYLDNDLTINDVVEVMLTNRLYISRAISHCTGRNFCQFVNYHRVSYAVELFRHDTQLKVVELANRSGFNSTTSFNNAFRLYIGEKPSEWCRKERARLINK